MARLQCTKCGKVFDKKAVVDYGAAGITGAKFGVGYAFLIWPLTMRIYATYPTCNEKGWLRVLLPWKN